MFQEQEIEDTTAQMAALRLQLIDSMNIDKTAKEDWLQ